MSTTIEVKQGQLEGITQKSVLTGKEFISYLGIPYAKPPIGDLRFQPPQPIDKWDGVLKAEKEGSPCIQKEPAGKIIGSEDCLYLNVHTPEHPTKSNSPKAVMIFIHGGVFYLGSGSTSFLSPDYLMNHDVILVTLNYRLHALGFLDMGTKNCAGNCGLRDQLLAIKWVKENIKQFGGDPENITIFGASTGATSVYFHILSPMSKGLFKRAIMQSDATSTYYERERNLQESGFKLGKKLGCDEKDAEKMVEFLKKQPAEEICKQAFATLEETAKNSEALKELFIPRPEIIKENAFLPDTYENLKKQAVPVPLITGLNNKDGRIAFAVPDRIERLKNDFTSVLVNKQEIDSNQIKDICDQIKKFYLGDKPVGEESVEKIADLYTDYFSRRIYESIDFIVSKVPVYIYEFSFFGKFSVYDKLIVKNLPAPTSGSCLDDLPYLFYPKLLLPPPVEFTEPEITVIKNMCSLWTNFAKSANPTASLEIQWKPYTPEKPCYLSINKDLKLVEEKLRGKEYEFWKKLPID